MNVEKTFYPLNPSDKTSKKDCCSVSLKYRTLSPRYPTKVSIRGPSNVKSLYTGIPNYYPSMMIEKPFNSLYEFDSGEYRDNNDVGYGLRQGYSFKYYPFTNRHIREELEYSQKLLPPIDIRSWTSYPVVSEGTTEYNKSSKFVP